MEYTRGRALQTSCLLHQGIPSPFSNLVRVKLSLYAFAALVVATSRGDCLEQQPPISSLAGHVEIVCKVDDHTFPAARSGSYADLFSGVALEGSEIERCTRAVTEELRKYPVALLDRYVRRIYLLKDLAYQGTEIGGTNFRQSGTICINAGPGAGDSTVARMLDHEMVHLLASAQRFPYRDWARLNPPGFRYGNGGLEAIRGGLARGDGNDATHSQGFARAYGTSDIGEDIACIGEMMFSGDQAFWTAVDRSPILKEKTEILSAYLARMDSEYSSSLFRMMPESRFVAATSRFEIGELVLFPDGGAIVAPSDPLRVITVSPGAAAVFPDRSGVQFKSMPTNSSPSVASRRTDIAPPQPPAGYASTRSIDGRWLIYASNIGLVRARGEERIIYKDGNKIYFQSGGLVFEPGRAAGAMVKAGEIREYTPGSVAILDP